MRPNTDKKIAGLLVPIFAIRTEQDLGIGDTEGVRQMADWCARHRLHVLQLLPINETGQDNSPYNAISAIALDPTTIAVSPERLPEMTRERFHALLGNDTLAKLQRGAVQYRSVKALKQALLWEAFQVFEHQSRTQDHALASQFRDFQKDNAVWLTDYCLFRTLMEENGGSAAWETWPVAQQTPAAAREWIASRPADKREALRLREQFFAYVQWIAHQQWTDVRRYADARGVRLMGDIPYGVSRNSADVWAHRDLFDLQWSGGAPPEHGFNLDEFTVKWGQNWGVPLYRWDTHRRHHFSWWKLRVRQTSRIFHLFRIDHVLGFYRIYAFPWKPEENDRFVKLSHEQAAHKTHGLLPRFWPRPDDNDHHKKINREQGENILHMILDAAGEAIVIAEDLGVVPDYVPHSLARLHIPGFKIPHFERTLEYTWKDAHHYPRLSIVTPATHDHDPLAARWRALWADHEDARTKQDHHRAHVTWLELQRFVWWCGWDGNHIPREFTPDLHEAYLRRLMQSSSWLAMLMITDVFAQIARFNVPGPMAESNWTERMDKPVSQLDADPALAAKTQIMERLVRESGRT